MIDPHLGVPIDAAYREETAQLLARINRPHTGAGAVNGSDPYLLRVRMRLVRIAGHHSVRAKGRRWSYLAAAHRMEMIARSLEEK